MYGGFLGRREGSILGTVAARGADGSVLRLTLVFDWRSSGHWVESKQYTVQRVIFVAF